MMCGGCVGQNRILLAIGTLSSCLLLGERNGGGDAGLGPDLARGVALPRGVLHEPRIAGTEQVLAAVAAADLELAGEDDHELASRGRMPIVEPAHVPLAERDLRGRN